MNFIKKMFGTKEEPIKNYSDFWNWFLQNQKQFHSIVNDGTKIQSHFFKKLSPKLEELRDGFYFVTGMYDDQTAELIFTADGNLKNIVFVEELVQSAPKINGWKFTALKPATDIENISIEMNGISFNKDNLSFFSTNDSENPDEINITLVYHNYDKNNAKTINMGCLIFIDNYLGELNSITLIDSINILDENKTDKELISIDKLKDFLIWREKEFIEKYEAVKHCTDDDTYVILEAELNNGNPVIAVMNSDLLKWEEKASYQWILAIDLTFNGNSNSGLPDNQTSKKLNDFEDDLLVLLNDKNGQLNIGRETANGTRTIYFACKDFRYPSKIMDEIKTKYKESIDLDFEIYKDKYWSSLNYYIDNIKN